jgi:hypothetical protein
MRVEENEYAKQVDITRYYYSDSDSESERKTYTTVSFRPHVQMTHHALAGS